MVTALEVALRHPREPEAYRQVLTSCLSDARLLRTLVQRLMEQVRAETDLADEPAAPVDAAALLDRCVQMIQPLAAQRQVELARSYTGPLEAVTRASRLRSIVTNLLDNAIAYNRPGGRVELACRRTDDQLVLSVRDTGIGIAPEHLPHVFEPFFRVDGNGLECEHLGLGLALVRAHVQALGGQVRAESSAGQWTQFTVSLPAGGSPAEEQKNNDVI
jgi:signal transduction histidine kinase